MKTINYNIPKEPMIGTYKCVFDFDLGESQELPKVGDTYAVSCGWFPGSYEVKKIDGRRVYCEKILSRIPIVDNGINIMGAA